MANKDNLTLAFHYLFDEAKNCYLVGARLTGSPETLKNAVLNGNDMDMKLEQLVEDGRWSDMGTARFVSAGQPDVYHTQKPFEVACLPAESGNPFSMLRATIYANNAMILQYLLSDKMEK